jgi:hypothetical protein
MFKSTYNRGFQLTFENGITVSVQFGTGNYCSRRSLAPTATPHGDLANRTVESADAEIAIWHKDSDIWFDFGSDQVKGWCTPNEVAMWITRASIAESIESLNQYKETYNTNS